jgi:hypothetical protein
MTRPFLPVFWTKKVQASGFIYSFSQQNGLKDIAMKNEDSGSLFWVKSGIQNTNRWRRRRGAVGLESDWGFELLHPNGQ